MTDMLDVATRKGLFRFRREAAGWHAGPPAFLGEPVSAVLADGRDGSLTAALALGHFGVKLHRSGDGGASWQEVAAPAFPAAPVPDAGAPSVSLVWTLVAGGANRPGRLWAGTLPGGLFRSDDAGASWQLVESLWNVPERKDWAGGGYDHPGIHSVLVDPADSRRLTVAVSTGGIWRSADDGATWRLVGEGLVADYMPPELAGSLVAQDPHRLVACPSAPAVVWCQHHNGIFLSEDGAETFRRIATAEPSAFGFAVAVHPHDPATAWFVPAVKDECRVPVDGRLVVSRTTDRAASFAVLSRGLPQQSSYDVVYRHALDVDRTGRRLAMGSTTGNLWLSEDAGESWSLLSAHLPPIAQVAFA